MTKQLTLNIHFHDDNTFSNFYPGSNFALYNYLQQSALEHCVYLWGESGTGRSHLLQASCQAAALLGLTVSYIPLKHHHQLSPYLLEGMETLDLICVDDVNTIANKSEWEEALFHFYNRTQTTKAKLIITADTPPNHLSMQLADLRSRLQASVIFQLKSLTDTEKMAALQLRAKARGMELNRETTQFLLNHYPRNMQALFQALEQLDKASLAAQRKLTIPFIKSVLVSR